MDAAVLIATISAGVAAAAAFWARQSAHAAERSAAAAERSAAADEAAANAAMRALEMERETTALARYEFHGETAPQLVVMSDYDDAEFVQTVKGLTGHVLNLGPGPIVVDVVRIDRDGEQRSALDRAETLEQGQPLQLMFSGIAIAALAGGHAPLQLSVAFRSARTPYRARITWTLRRDGSDVRGYPRWTCRRDGQVERLDRPA